MDTKERMFVIEKKSKTLPGVAVSRTVTFPDISIAELERDLHDEAVETADTEEFPIPEGEDLESDDDFEGPTGVYEMGPHYPAAQVYWVQLT